MPVTSPPSASRRQLAMVFALAAWVVALAISDGAYFLLAGALGATPLAVAAALAVARQGAAAVLSLPSTRIALALAAMALVTAASIGWSATGHRAWLESIRWIAAALAVAAGGAWLRGAWHRHALASGIAAGIVGLALALSAWLAAGPEDATSVLSFGELAWPTGNSNATGAWLVVGTMCATGAWLVDGTARTRASTAAGCAAITCSWSLVLAANSTGSWIATLGALGVLVWFAPGRRLLAWNGGCAVVAWLVAHRAADHLVAVGLDTTARQGGSTAPVDASTLAAAAASVGRAALLAAVLAAVVVPAAAALVARLPRPRVRRPRPRTLLASAAVVLVAIVSTLALSATARNAVSPGSVCPVPPPPTADGFQVDSSVAYDFRCDYWRVAIVSFAERPLHGWGSGSFHTRYMMERRGPEQPRDPHSLPLRVAGDLGVLGLVPFLTAIVLVGRGWWRHRARLDGASIASVGATGAWLAHASIDFTFNVLATTLPVLLLAGAVASAGVDDAGPARQPRRRRLDLAVAVAIMLAWATPVLPQVAADRSLRRAEDPRTAPEDALTAARRAAALDPTWARPRLAEAFALVELERPQAASDAADDAQRREPELWSVHVTAARIHAATNHPGRAARARAAALHGNPQLATGA